jgi:hypothetical protein
MFLTGALYDMVTSLDSSRIVEVKYLLRRPGSLAKKTVTS